MPAASAPPRSSSAKLGGARVIACAGTPEKVELAARARRGHGRQPPAGRLRRVCREQTQGRGVDVIVDFVGGAYFERHQTCLAEAGRWIIVGLLGGAQGKLDLGAVLRRRWQLLGLVMRSRSAADKAAIVERFAAASCPSSSAARLRPIIDRVYPWSEVRSAHERMEQNANQGKIVLEVSR